MSLTDPRMLAQGRFPVPCERPALAMMDWSEGLMFLADQTTPVGTRRGGFANF
ncbi:hypothetical protein CHELA40_12975 [Chelatococcus asaccharovorans]|nr:hypothetical protein CHELA40_12975 [Chelatococcus asaccharovorans]CAH1681037.1 hypothetical protein CHELA17_62644 [Chelatococcus asaccharovorans]